MISKLNTLKQQAQDVILRLFNDSAKESSTLPLHSNYYTCARCGTHARLKRYNSTK
ncbi:MAG: hypothetical protein ACI4AI_01185 [Paludibacteraceae bacterium]